MLPSVSSSSLSSGSGVSPGSVSSGLCIDISVSYKWPDTNQPRLPSFSSCDICSVCSFARRRHNPSSSFENGDRWYMPSNTEKGDNRGVVRPTPLRPSRTQPVSIGPPLAHYKSSSSRDRDQTRGRISVQWPSPLDFHYCNTPQLSGDHSRYHTLAIPRQFSSQILNWVTRLPTESLNY